MRTPLAVVFLLLAACKSGPAAYKEDIQTICDGPSLTDKKVPGARAGMDPSQQSRIIAQVVLEKLSTSDGKAFFNGLSAPTLSAKDKGKKLTDEATRVGIAKCEMATWYASQ